MNKRILILALLFIASCRPATSVPATIPTSTRTETPTTIPSPTFTPTPSREWDYTVVYQSGDFAIRETLLSVGDIDWERFEIPPTRIEDSNPNDIQRPLFAENNWNQLKETGWWAQVFKINKARGETDIYKLEYDFPLTGAGNCKLFKNDRFVWGGHMNGGITFPIAAMRQVDYELAISYRDSDYDGDSISWAKNIVLITSGYTVTVIENAFAADEVLGRLIYFSEKDGKASLVFDGKVVGNQYQRVFDQTCCWDGPPMQIRGNGEIIDFIAKKDGNWYHVQAGSLEYLSSLK